MRTSSRSKGAPTPTSLGPRSSTSTTPAAPRDPTSRCRSSTRLGNLIYISRNSNVVGDQPTPTASAQVESSYRLVQPARSVPGQRAIAGRCQQDLLRRDQLRCRAADRLVRRRSCPRRTAPRRLANPTLPTVPLPLSLRAHGAGRQCDGASSRITSIPRSRQPTPPTRWPSFRSIPPAATRPRTARRSVRRRRRSCRFTPTFIDNPNLNQPNSIISSLGANVSSFGFGATCRYSSRPKVDNPIPTQLFSVNRRPPVPINNKGNRPSAESRPSAGRFSSGHQHDHDAQRRPAVRRSNHLERRRQWRHDRSSSIRPRRRIVSRRYRQHPGRAPADLSCRCRIRRRSPITPSSTDPLDSHRRHDVSSTPASITLISRRHGPLLRVLRRDRRLRHLAPVPRQSFRRVMPWEARLAIFNPVS